MIDQVYTLFFTQDGYVYSPEELDAYRIPLPFRDRCVNFYVPFFKCQ